LGFASVIAALWGVLEHFGKSPSCALITGNFNASCWVQDVQLRVICNIWPAQLDAGWMAAILPLTFVLFFVEKSEKLKNSGGLARGFLRSLPLLFSLPIKIRNCCFGICAILFSVLTCIFHFNDFKKKYSKATTGCSSSLTSRSYLFGTPWTPTIFDLSK